MIQKLLALALCATMLASAGTRQPTIPEQASAIPKGTLVEVKLSGKAKPSKVVGRFQEADQQRLQVLIPREDTVETLNVAFTDMKSIKVLASADEDVIQKETRSPWTVVRNGLVTTGNVITLGLFWLLSDGG